MSMGGRNGINMSSSSGSNNLPGTMVGWNNNVNFGNIGYGNGNGWPGQIGWNNVNLGNIGNNRGNNYGNINSPDGLVNGRHLNDRNGFMVGFNNNMNYGNIGNIVGDNVNSPSGLVNGRYPNYPDYSMVGVNNNINIGNGYGSNAAYDQAMDMADAMSGMGNININNGGWPGSKKKKKGGWWRKR
jgi:hypothetical protein